MKQVSDKVNLVMRRFQSKGKKLTAKEALSTEKVNEMVRLDEGYFIFRTLRNSPVYFESRKKDLFAMIRQLGLPTWFMSLSAADSKWIDLLQILGKLVDGKEYSEDEVKAMDWNERTRLIRSDPVTCSRYFDNRVHEFMKIVLESTHSPLGKICDSFVRVEFQQRGSPHVHVLLWTENAPKYEIDKNEDIVDFVDRYVSCSSDVPEEHAEFLQYQQHQHSTTCRKKGKAVCRFGFPIPPIGKTCIH